jgi:methylated-DNA-protein-cysteine methyltransferase-like protein
MIRNMSSDFRSSVLAVVRQVPHGQVATYGQIALLAGKPGAARQVGYVLHGARNEDDVPWQRIINAQGRISTFRLGFGDLQRELLRSEGISVSNDGKLDLKTYLWNP